LVLAACVDLQWDRFYRFANGFEFLPAAAAVRHTNMGACTSLFAPPAPRSKVYLLDAYVPDPVIACFRQLETSGAALSSVVFANMREGDISFVQDLEAGTIFLLF
jgi:hypothetical protein